VVSFKVILLYFTEESEEWVRTKLNQDSRGWGHDLLSNIFAIRRYMAYKYSSEIILSEYTIILEITITLYNICRIWGCLSEGYEELYIPGYNAVQYVENQSTFRRKKFCLLLAPCWSLVCLLLYPKDGGGVGWLTSDYRELYARRLGSSIQPFVRCIQRV
jgi:hypothetical protein